MALSATSASRRMDLDRQVTFSGSLLWPVAIGLALRGLLQVENLRIEGRHLQRREAAFRREGRDPLERAQPRIRIDELRDEQAGSLDCLHVPNAGLRMRR